jgi:hypothetical protein
MTSSTITRPKVLRHAAQQASLAPSIHNTQPWRFVIDGNALEIWSDRSRQLAVLDPTERQLLISCGCALMNARIAMAARGYEPIVERLPDDDRADLVARLTLPETRSEWLPLGDLDEQVVRRQTNRRHFEDEPVNPAVVYQLVEAAQQEGAVLSHVQDREHRQVLARLSQHADDLENANPAYRAELRRWTTDDLRRKDGVPAMTVPHVTGESHDEIPIRDFDTHGIGWLPTRTGSSIDQCLLILGTAEDNRLAWLKAGEALQHLWLRATKTGYVASLFTQVVEVPGTREQLRTELSLMMHPHVVLRVGRASHTSASGRRNLTDLLTERETPRTN